MRFITILTSLACIAAASAADKAVTYPAADTAAVRFVGRTLAADDGSVTFDWSGTYAETRIEGRELQLRLSDTGRSYFDVTVDGRPAGKFKAAGNDTTVVVATGLSRGVHDITLRKRTEGETGRTTFHEFILPRGGSMTATGPRGRFIEVIGNSLSAGFGTEGLSRDEPFTPENENCNLSYSTIIPRYFDADYAIIAHSGQGAVRNYGDPLRMSLTGTMNRRYHQTLDCDTTYRWAFEGYRPDLVIVNLGANDFMTEPNPYRREFVEGYTRLLNTILDHYGRDTRILCVIPYAVQDDVVSYFPEAVAATGAPYIYIARQSVDHINATTDRGAVWHPNYNGQRKMAMMLIPYISTIMDWPLTSAAVE